ncbi:MAG: DUF2332 domain-containing protein [Burkholderiaceae bacterium]|nr:DUF2332 domain-containing protein [Roseateles sp.]MBV8470528.1 DUF2332 domain-containing protein [Burkholderiaceae bacterium]
MDFKVIPSADELRQWADLFRRFASHDGRDDPLYRAVSAIVAESPGLLALLAEAPATQRLPVLWLAAVHERVLAAGPGASELAAYYPSVGGQRAPDAVLSAALHRFVDAEHAALVDHLRRRATQTNEIGRCAVLRPALQAISERTGRPRLALFDFGCSAGLNLAVDRYGYTYRHTCPSAQSQIATEGSDPDLRLVCHLRGAVDPQAWREPTWTLAARAGADLAPILADDLAGQRWLEACLWPHDAARRSRLRAGLRLIRDLAPTLTASEDGLGVFERWLTGLPADVQPVLFNSWVLAYFDAAALARYHARALALVEQRGVAWVCAEMGSRSALQLAPACPDGESPGSATLWALHWRQADGRRRDEALAWSHPHGRWMQYLA